MQNMSQDQKQILDAALAYVSMQLPVIPLCPASHAGMSHTHRERCTTPGKTPVVRDWTSIKTMSAEDIQSSFETNPHFNLGLILGATNDWNIVGVDVDGPVGVKALEEWSQGNLPTTWEFVTKQGRRYLYALPAGLATKKAKQIEPGGDGELALLVTGQQTVMPPSIHHTGFLYQWIEGRSPQDIPIAEAPTWIINRVGQWDAPGTNAAASMDLSHFTTEVLSTPVTAEDWTREVSSGGRSNHLTKLVGSLLARRIPKDQLKAMVYTLNEQKCKPPLPNVEIDAMIETLSSSEERKRELRKARKLGVGTSKMQPLVVADGFLKSQTALGISWRYTDVRGSFYKCHDAVGPWVECSPLYLHQAIRPFLIALNPEWCNSSHVLEVVSALREVLAEVSLDDIFDMGASPDLEHIHLLNGTLHWRTEQLRPWDSTCYATWQLPLRWDPAAKDSELRTRWDTVLKEWLPNESVRLYLQEYFGYCLIPDCSRRVALLLFGGGRNGKSLFLEIIGQIFGKYINHVPLNRLTDRFETANLVDKLVNICADIDDKYLQDTGELKAIISGDRMRGERKYGKSFHFVPTCRMVFSANVLPKSNDKSEGWYARWRFVKFPNQFEVNSSYTIDLRTAFRTPEGLAAIFSWALEGLQRLQNTGEFTQSHQLAAEEAQYRADNDSVVAFVQDTIEITADRGAGSQLACKALHAVYRSWCEQTGNKPVSLVEFNRRMIAAGVEKGVRSVNKKSMQVFLSVSLKSSEQVDLDVRGAYNLEVALMGSR